MPSARAVARHRAVYRALLIAYPRQFRREYGAPMVQLFGDQLRDTGGRVWLRAAPDLVRTAPTQRIEALMSKLNAAPRIAAVAVVVLALVTMAFGVGGPVVLLLAVPVAAVLVAQRRLLGALSRGERAPMRPAITQTWWAPVAALIGLVELVFGFGTIFEASTWGGRVVGSTLLMACGLGTVLGLMRRPFAREGGNILILVGTVPALTVFWVVVPTVLALIVWIGVISSGFSDTRAVEPVR